MYHVYALVSDDNAKIYIGQTNELKRRLSEHNDLSRRGSLYTKRNKGPWRLLIRWLTDSNPTRGANENFATFAVGFFIFQRRWSTDFEAHRGLDFV